MGRKSGIKLSTIQKKKLREFMSNTKDKREYRAASGILMREEGKSAHDISRHLGVTIKQVFSWTRFFLARGVIGIHMKKPTGRKPTKAQKAKKIIPLLLHQDPQAFGYLKGRWVLRDIAKELGKEGVTVNYSTVHRILADLSIVLKSPKFRAPGSIHKNYRKRAQIHNYKRAAGMLKKNESSLHFKMKSGLNSSENLSAVGFQKEK